MIKPIILAGGTGTRLWPLSRQSYPKQFLCLLDNQHSLFQQTALRMSSINQVEAPIVICNQEHYFICTDQLKAININNAHYILEPQGRNTAPAIAVAAFYELQSAQKDTHFLVMPSDHLIKDVEAFSAAIALGMQAAQDYLITFAITPTQPETGYGYIECGANLDSPGVYKVAAFIEKPDLAHAEYLLSTSNHYWNSGIFLFKASTYLQELKLYARDIYDAAEQAVEKAIRKESLLQLEEKSFSICRNESIDYAVMEKTTRAATIPLSVGWSDLGCWKAVSAVRDSDSHNNVIQGDVLTYKTENCFINAGDKLVATAGLKDHIVVSTNDSVLVAHKDYAQSVKTLVQELQKVQHKVVDTNLQVYRPWGYFVVLTDTPNFKVKILVVNPGKCLSLQMHHQRSEHWIVVEGVADIICGEENIQLTKNQYTYIPAKAKHRLSNNGSTSLMVIETQLGDYLGEDDIVRYEDAYSRECIPT